MTDFWDHATFQPVLETHKRLYFSVEHNFLNLKCLNVTYAAKKGEE